MSPLEYASLFAAVLVGGVAGLYFPNWRGRSLHLVLSFSGAYLLGITFLHIIPDAYTTPGAIPGLAVLAGFFLQLLLEQFSSGVEHGHIHVADGERLALSVLFGLSLHALLEGAPLPHVGEGGADLHEHLLTGILLHKVPAGFALAVLLTQANYRRSTVWALLAVFAVMTPLGSFLAAGISAPSAEPYILGLVIGSLIHVSTTILFELDDAHHHRLSWSKFAAIAAGICTAMLTAYI